MFKRQRFEEFMLVDLDLKSLFGRMFFMWDGNHRLQAWMPYFCYVHGDDASWHISMDSILMYTFHGMVELLIAMTNLNK